MYLKAVKGILVLGKVKLPQMYKKWHFIHMLKTGIFFIGKKRLFHNYKNESIPNVYF